MADEVRPDAIVVDGFMLAAYDAADRLALPTAALCHCSYALFAGPWGERVMGVPVAGLFDRVHRVLVPTHPAYEGIEAVPPNVDFVGAITRPGVAATEDELVAADVAELLDRRTPWLLLSMSTTNQGQSAVLPGLLDALSRLPVHVLLTLGGAVDPGSVEAPANVLVRGYVAHELVLPHVDAFVTHAGMSGIATALSFGRPLVCLPQGRDQGFNAARVDELGAGISLAAGAAPEAVAAAAARVLADPSYAAVARRFADPAGRRDPVEAALALLEPARRTAGR